MRLAQLDADRRLLDVEGGRPDRDQHEIGHGNTGFDQIDLGGAGVDEGPLPTLAEQQLDRLGRRVDFDQLGVLGLAAPRPPAGEALLRIEIQQGDALGFLSRTHGESAHSVVFPVPPLVLASVTTRILAGCWGDILVPTWWGWW